MTLIQIGDRILNLDLMTAAVFKGDRATVCFASSHEDDKARVVPFREVFDGEDAAALRERLEALVGRRVPVQAMRFTGDSREDA